MTVQNHVWATTKYSMVTVKKFRSHYESVVAKNLPLDTKYEPKKIAFTEIKNRKYTPDFELPNGILVETKGRWTVADRQKHLLVREQHPELDIRILFQRATNTISKKSKTTYAQWCDSHGIVWHQGTTIPKEWMD